MEINKLTTIVTLLIALSIASERLVEIIKGLVPWLNQEYPDEKKATPDDNKDATPEDKKKIALKRERQRRAVLQALAVVAGIITACLARPAIPADISAPSWRSTIALGFLTSGGSGLWNSVLTYFLKIKDIKKLEAEEMKKAANPATTPPPAS